MRRHTGERGERGPSLDGNRKRRKTKEPAEAILGHDGTTERRNDGTTKRSVRKCKRLSSRTHDPDDRIQIYWPFGEQREEKSWLARSLGVNGSQGFYDLDSESTAGLRFVFLPPDNLPGARRRARASPRNFLTFQASRSTLHFFHAVEMYCIEFLANSRLVSTLSSVSLHL